MPTILTRLAAASAELQAAHDAAKVQRRHALAAAITAAQWAINKCYPLLAGKAVA